MFTSQSVLEHNKYLHNIDNKDTNIHAYILLWHNDYLYLYINGVSRGALVARALPHFLVIGYL